jgi:glycine/D-amino acid oxidase-like deaminating enzyme
MYDPIVDTVMPVGQDKPTSFWALNSDSPHPTYPHSNTDIETDVAIIGGGYTGLSAALHLSKTHKVDCTLLEANHPGWGCSGRNGGFVLPGTGRLSVQQITNRWGKSKAQAIYSDYLSSVDDVKLIIEQSKMQHGLDCQMTDGGYLKLAHKASFVEKLHAQAHLLNTDYGDAIIPLSGAEIEQDYLSGMPSYGGVFYPKAFGVNPWLLSQGIAKQASAAGAKIIGNTAVLTCKRQNNKHYIQTNHGVVTAKHLIVATNGYGLRKLHTNLTDRMFPVLSSILVTPPLSQEQLQSIGMRAGLMVMDTRPLKYYYRLLPDNRLLFGGRGALSGKNANTHKSQQQLLSGLRATFSQLGDIEIDQFWSGWVSVSLDDYPRIHHDRAAKLSYSGGYCGSGLAFSIQAGKRLSQQLCAPSELPDLPYFTTPLKRFPLASCRRTALQAFYMWEGLKTKF